MRHTKNIKFIALTEDRPFGMFKWLQKLYADIKAGKTDGVIAVVGSERVGKTTLSIRLAYALDRGAWFIKGKPDVSRICLNGSEYRSRMSDTKKSIIIFDEAGTAMFSRDAMTPETKRIAKKLMVCGYKNCLHILNLPDYFSLDSQVCKHRLRAVIRLPEKGKVLTYNKRKAVFIRGARSWDKVSPMSRGWWAHSNSTPELDLLMRAYRKKERVGKDKYMTDDIKIIEKEKDKKDDIKAIAHKLYKGTNATQKEIALSLGVTERTLRNWFKDLGKPEE